MQYLSRKTYVKLLTITHHYSSFDKKCLENQCFGVVSNLVSNGGQW